MDVPDLDSPFEVIRDETGIISPMSAPKGRHEEGLLRMRLRILHKALECEVDLMGTDVRADCRHGIALSLRSLGDSYPGTELPPSSLEPKTKTSPSLRVFTFSGVILAA